MIKLTRRNFLVVAGVSTFVAPKVEAAVRPAPIIGPNLYVALTRMGVEATYRNYSRAAIPRDFTHWLIDGRRVQSRKPIVFPVCTGGSETLDGVALLLHSDSPLSEALYVGSVVPSIMVSPGVTGVLVDLFMDFE